MQFINEVMVDLKFPFKFINLFQLLVIFMTYFTSKIECCGRVSSFKTHVQNFNSNKVSDLISDNYEEIRIHVDWSHFDTAVPQTDQAFAEAIKKSIIPRTINIYSKIAKVRRFKNKLKFTNRNCDIYSVPDYLINEGVDADIVIFPVLEKKGEFLKDSTEAAALYCSLSEINNRPIMGFIEYRPNLKAGDDVHIDYHIWLTIHELMHVFVFNDSLFDKFVDPKTFKPLGIQNVMKKEVVNNMDMNYVVSPKVKEMAIKHFNCPNAIGVPLENKGDGGSKDGHWNRKAMNGDVMIAKSFGENLISDITLALFEDSGWYQVDYSLSNLFIWGKNRGCDFLNCKSCFSKNHVDLTKNTFDIKSLYPREFCSNFNNPVCSTHNIFKGNCNVKMKSNNDESIKVMPFTNSQVAGGDIFLDYCPTPMEIKTNQDYYSGSCRVGDKSHLNNFEKICPNCACVITDISKSSKKTRVIDFHKINKKRFNRGSAIGDNNNQTLKTKASNNLNASCLEYKCDKGELYISILNNQYHCNKRYISIPNLGTVKCPLKSLICHEKYKCKFGCVEKHHN